MLSRTRRPPPRENLAAECPTGFGTMCQFRSPRMISSHCHLHAVGQRIATSSPGARCHSPPENSTPSELTDRVLMMALCPLKFWTKVPSGHFHFLMLLPPADADAKLYSVGWMASARTDFLWCVRVSIVLPAARSHSL